MWNSLVSGLSDSFKSLWAGFADFLPELVAAVIVLIVGVIIAELLGKAVKHVIQAVKLDSLVRKAGAEHYFNRAGVRLDTGVFLGAVVKWFLVIVFLVEALDLLNLAAVTVFLQHVLGYLPHVIVAILVLFAGLVIGEVMERVVASSARAADLGRSNLLGTVTRWSVWVFAALVALYELGVAAVLSESVFNGIVVAFALALGLAFGLGGQGAAADFIASVRRDISEKK